MPASYASSTIKSKWKKTKWLLEDSRLKPYVPATALFSKSKLQSMLAAYSTVYFKPVSGSGGKQIIRITRKDGGFQTQLDSVKTTYKTQDALYKGLMSYAGKKNFLLQKGINLARTRGKPFDIRVMVQKTNKGSWISSALFTKVGHPGKVATNYNQGGTVGFLHSTLAGAGYRKTAIVNTEAKLKELGVWAGQRFDKHKKGFRELGLDVALDSKGRPWILEVNTRPQFYPLKDMKDKSVYNRILRYSKAYGRTK